MTLLDAPRFDEVRDRRRRLAVWGSVATFTLLVIVFWIVSGFPVDWPWNWLAHLQGRAAINRFLTKVEGNDLATAYGIWVNDPKWQQSGKTYEYPFKRFEQDWSPASPDNEYGPIKSHQIAAARKNGNVLIVGVYVNGRRSKPIFLDYDPKAHTLGYSPVELYLGP